MSDDDPYSSEESPTSNHLPCSHITIRGRRFTPEELEFIQHTVNEQYDSGRTHISRVVCEELDWRQPNGWLKDRACRDVLRQLDAMGLTVLPPPLVTRQSNGAVREPRSSQALEELGPPIIELADDIRLQFAKGNRSEGVWNDLVDNYHYLGHKVAVGRCIKYLVYSTGSLIGAISFSSPAWQLASRDTIIPLIGIETPSIHDVTINNSRFLILPNVRVPNLASQILSLATKKVVVDWTNYYEVEPLIAETFVESDRYLGTCYRAANWIEVGQTKGYAKKGTSYRNGQTSKLVFLYGLNRSIRRKLLAIRDML